MNHIWLSGARALSSSSTNLLWGVPWASLMKACSILLMTRDKYMLVSWPRGRKETGKRNECEIFAASVVSILENTDSTWMRWTRVMRGSSKTAAGELWSHHTESSCGQKVIGFPSAQKCKAIGHHACRSQDQDEVWGCVHPLSSCTQMGLLWDLWRSVSQYFRDRKMC